MDFTASFNTTNSVASSNLRSPNVRCHALIVSTYIRKWLHLHQSTTNLCFYSSTSPCPLPINILTSILKSCKISGHLLLRDSKDR